MLKINGNIESIKLIENLIHQVPHKEVSNSSPDYPIQGQEFASRVQTKVLAVQVDPLMLKINYGLVKRVMRSEVLEVKAKLSNIKISFYYDNRNDEANLKVDPEEVVTLCDIVKGFKEAIANVKTNTMSGLPQGRTSETRKEPLG